jgi:hypothetical protein
MANKSYQDFLSAIDDIKKTSTINESTNPDRLELYSQAELLKMDFEEHCSTNLLQSSETDQVIEKIIEIQSSLKLRIKGSKGTLSSML